MIFVQNPLATRTKQPQLSYCQVSSASQQNTIVIAGASGTKITGLQLINTDTIDHASIKISVANFILGLYTVTAGAGSNGNTPALDCFNSYISGFPIDSDGQKYFFLAAANSLIIANAGAANNAPNKFVIAVCNYQDF